MTSKKIILMLLLIVASSVLYAQKTDSNIIGHVIDKNTGEHIPFATIILDGSTLGATSDETGHYMITNISLQ